MSSNIQVNQASGINPSFNDLLTMYSNGTVGFRPTKSQLTFLKDGYHINTIRQDLFCKTDFPSLTPVYYRQMTHQLKHCLEKVIDSRPCFFKLKGVTVNSITIKDTTVRNVSTDFEKILERLKHQPPYIHDIKTSTHTDGLYEGLIKHGHITHKQNSQIIIKEFQIISKFKTTATISRTGTLTLHIGCTHNPVPYSISGFDELIQYLGQVIFVLTARAGDSFCVAPIHNWLIVHYHFNKDGIIIDSPMHHYSIHDLQEHSQIYLKKFPNGKVALRWERKITPDTTIEEEQNKSGEEQIKYKVSFDNARELYHD
jgi:hypothetical protein